MAISRWHTKVPIGPFIENDLELPFLDLNVSPADVGIDVVDYDSRS